MKANSLGNGKLELFEEMKTKIGPSTDNDQEIGLFKKDNKKKLLKKATIDDEVYRSYDIIEA
jgi:hypothetical protein